MALAWRFRIPDRFFDREEIVSAKELFLCREPADGLSVYVDGVFTVVCVEENCFSTREIFGLKLPL